MTATGHRCRRSGAALRVALFALALAGSSAAGLLSAGRMGATATVDPERPGYLQRMCLDEAGEGVAVGECRKDAEVAQAATEKYRDASVAAAEGFVPVSDCVETAAGAMGQHWGRIDRLEDAKLDPAEPELLLYVPTVSGLTLVGAEWVINADQATTAPRLFGRRFDGPMEGHNPLQPRHYDIHVWLWAHNPEGLFAHFNPNLSCNPALSAVP